MIALIFTILLAFLETSLCHFEQEFVSCGSIVRIVNVDADYNLHSHSISWGSGSNQQSVTCLKSKSDHSSLWQINLENKLRCSSGTPIKCGSKIRLMHIDTGKNLHSHRIQSMLSGQQEMSCFGNTGFGDAGDDFNLHCSQENLRVGDYFYLQHAETQAYLATDSSYVFNTYNCGRSCPTMGQLEGNTLLHIAVEAAQKFGSPKEEQIESWKSTMRNRAEIVFQQKVSKLPEEQQVSVETAVQEFFKVPDLVLFKYLSEIAHIPLSIKNGDGQTAFDLAEKYNLTTVKQYLEEQQSSKVSARRLIKNLSQNLLKLIAEFM